MSRERRNDEFGSKIKLTTPKFSGEVKDWNSFKRAFIIYLKFHDVELTTDKKGIWTIAAGTDGAKKDVVLYLTLRQALDDGLYATMDATNEEGSGLKAWMNLSKRFDPNTVQRRLQLFQKLMAMRPEDTSLVGIADFHSEMNCLYQEWNAQNVSKDEQICFWYLHTMKEQYPELSSRIETMVSKIGGENITENTLFELQAGLEATTEFMMAGMNKTDTNSAYLNKTSNQQQQGKENWKTRCDTKCDACNKHHYTNQKKCFAKGKTCTDCGEFDHFAKSKLCKGPKTEKADDKTAAEKDTTQTVRKSFVAKALAAPMVDRHHDNERTVILDGGCTISALPYRELFDEIRPTNTVYEGFGSSHVKAAGIGQARLGFLTAEGIEIEIVLEATYCPDQPPLLSEGQLDDKGFSVFTAKGKKIITIPDGDHTHDIIFKKGKRDKLYTRKLLPTVEEMAKCMIAKPTKPIQTHWLLAHAGKARLTNTLNAVTFKGDKLPASLADQTCKDCAKCQEANAPSTSMPDGKHEARAFKPGQAAMLDVQGPFPISKDMKRYAFNLIDLHSNYPCTVMLTDVTCDNFIRAAKELRRLWLDKLEEVPSDHTWYVDNYSSIASDKFVDEMRRLNIEIHTCAPYRHESAGKVERFNRQMNETMRVIMHDAKQTGARDREYWTYAHDNARYTFARTAPASGSQTPYERHYGKIPAILNVKKGMESTKTRHVNMRLARLREMVSTNVISLDYVETSNNTADMLTKPLGKLLHEKHRNKVLQRGQPDDDRLRRCVEKSLSHDDITINGLGGSAEETKSCETEPHPVRLKSRINAEPSERLKEN